MYIRNEMMRLLNNFRKSHFVHVQNDFSTILGFVLDKNVQRNSLKVAILLE